MRYITKFMSILTILKNKIIWKHIAVQVGIIVMLLLITYYWLNIYTYHGETIEVPNFTGLTLEQAKQTAEAYKLKIILLDSVHFIDKPKGTIISQTPEPKHKVKPNRTIYIILNGFENEKIPMPDLRGISIRQAQSDAELFGLKIGRLTYVPDISTTVLEQHYKGKPIAPNTMIPKGSIIDLVIGKGESNEKTNIVCIIGKTLAEAKSILTSHSLNIGSIIADKTLTNSADSSKAFIWKQSPSCNLNSPISLGSYIDVWITLDKDLLPDNNIIEL